MKLDQFNLKLLELIEKLLLKSEKEIRKLYRQVSKEVLDELFAFFEKYGNKGVLSLADVTKYNRLNEFLGNVNSRVDEGIVGLFATLHELSGTTYTTAYYRTAHAIQTTALVKVPFKPIKARQIEAAINNPIKGLTLTETLEKNRQELIYHINRDVKQTIARGATYEELAATLKDRFEGDYNKAIRVARTETHRIREQGTLDSVHYASSKGVEMVKKWRNMKDSRVRKTSKANHQKMEGVQIEADALFDLGKGEFATAPGNSGYAHHDINCRCILVYEIAKVTGTVDAELGNQPFEEFEKEVSA